MMTFVNTCSEGLTILPTHRLAANLHDFSWSEARRYLEPWFEAQTFPFADDGQKTEAQKKFLAHLQQSRGANEPSASTPPRNLVSALTTS